MKCITVLYSKNKAHYRCFSLLCIILRKKLENVDCIGRIPLSIHNVKINNNEQGYVILRSMWGSTFCAIWR